jgi:hypothetical protein
VKSIPQKLHSGDGGRQTARGSGDPPRSFSRHFVSLFGCVGDYGEFCFLSKKKLPNSKKDFKTVRSEAQNQQIVGAEKCVTAAIERNSLKVDGSPPTPTRRFFARKCRNGSLLRVHTVF